MARPCTGKWQSSAGKGSCVWTQQTWIEELMASLNQVGVDALQGAHLLVHLCVEQGINLTSTDKERRPLTVERMRERTANDVKNYWNSHLDKRLSAKPARREVPAAPRAHTVVYKPQAQRVSIEPVSCWATCSYHGKEASTLELFAATGQCEDGRPISCSRAVKLQSATVAWTGKEIASSMPNWMTYSMC